MDKLTKNLDRAIWDKNESDAKLTTDGTDYRSETRPWHTVLEKSFDKPRPLYYEAEGKFISFKPVGTSQPILLAKDKSLSYEGIWEDASLEIELSRDHWKKLVRIDRLPKTTEKYVD